MVNKNNTNSEELSNSNNNLKNKQKINLKKKIIHNSKNIVIKPFNKELTKQFKKIKFLNENNDNLYKDKIDKYKNSFNDIIEFSKKITSTKKKQLIV